MHASGDVEIAHGAVSSADSIVGVTPRLGTVDPGEIDLAAAGGLSALGTTYELFTFSKPFDLIGETLLFEAP